MSDVFKMFLDAKAVLGLAYSTRSHILSDETHRQVKSS